jgi:hypothetical protein
MVHNWHTLASLFRAGQEAIDEIGSFVRKVTSKDRQQIECTSAEGKDLPNSSSSATL